MTCDNDKKLDILKLILNKNALMWEVAAEKFYLG